MEENITIFNKTPSALYSLWKAFRSRNSSYSLNVEYPVIHSVRSGLVINKSHLKAFYEICDLSHQLEIPLKAAGDSGGSKHPDVY
jgi:phage-related protein